MKNIVLIGMPGCGKSHISKLLSQILNMETVDTDDMIVENAGCSISEIFARDGEKAFRDMESAMAKKASKLNGAIIATGGGIILRKENMEALKQNGMIFFRDRPVKAIAGENHSRRPLIGSDLTKLYKLYDERIDLYRSYADYVIENTDTVEEAANQIALIYEKEG